MCCNISRNAYNCSCSNKKVATEKGGLKPHMRRYLAISDNTEIAYYSNYRIGSKGNKEDLERETRQRYSARDAR